MRASAPSRLGAGVNLMVGLGVFGAAGYVFVAIIGYAFTGPGSAADISALTSFYLLMNIVGPGLFAALEPETSRAVSASVAVGQSTRPVVLRAARLALWILAGFTVVAIALWPVLLSTVLGGRVSLLVALVLGAAGAAAVFSVRGVLSGERRFGRYALTLYLEGGARLIPCVALFLLGVREPGLYGIAFAAGTAVAAAALLPAVRPGPNVAGRNDHMEHMGRSVAFLATAMLLTQLVTNLAPVVVTYRMPDDLVEASAFSVAFVLARIPLMLFSPIQAVLLPHLSNAAAKGQLDVVSARVRQAIAVVLALGLPATIACTIAGPWAVRLLFNASTTPSRWTFALLGASAVLIMVALVLQPALVALQHQRTVTVAWITGTVVYVTLLFAPFGPITAAMCAQLVGPAVVLAVAGGHLRHILRAGPVHSRPVG